MSLPLAPSSLKQRLAIALRRRLHPNTGLHQKALCHALRVTENTLNNWLSGNNDPRGEHILRLIGFFDAAFGNELLGPHGALIVKFSDVKAADAARRFNEAKAELTVTLTGTEP